MGRLFLKIFLSFWLTSVLIFGLTFLMSEGPRFREAHEFWQSTLARSLRINAYVFVKSYEDRGCEAVTPYFHDLSGARQLKFFLLDEQGKSLCGEDAPALAVSLAAVARQRGDSEGFSPQGDRFAAQRAQNSHGQYNTLVIQIPSSMQRPPRPSPWPRLLIAISVSALICFWLARYLTAPDVGLRGAARRLAEGDLSARAAGNSSSQRHDEIAELVTDFDHMAERLENLISSQKRLIRDISHELRSPLARLSFALALARREASPNAGSAVLDRIQRESERLNNMVAKMLTLSRLESGLESHAGLIDQASVNVAELVREVVEDADFEARSRNCRVTCIFTSENSGAGVAPHDPCETIGNPELLRSAIENVVRNGVHYTAENTEVHVQVSCSSYSIAITVSDEGPGVPEEELAKLFRPFYRVDNARDRQSGGAGLGLAIAEQSIHLHKGTIVAAPNPGGGLKVTLTLPKV